MSDLENVDDNTPLTDEEKDGLRLPLFSKTQLNEAEANNIGTAQSWALLRKRPIPPERILTEKWLKQLHYKMYEEVWSWAGDYRLSEKNIGVKPWEIRPHLRILLDDVNFWIKDSTPSALNADEIAIRLSHRAVQIHPFPNGNGRWSRLMADALVVSFGKTPFTWGTGLDLKESDLRRQYIEALKFADLNLQYGPFLQFARS